MQRAFHDKPVQIHRVDASFRRLGETVCHGAGVGCAQIVSLLGKFQFVNVLSLALLALGTRATL